MAFTFEFDTFRSIQQMDRQGFEFFSEHFEGILVTTSQCVECETPSEQRQTIINLDIPFTDNTQYENSETFIRVS